MEDHHNYEKEEEEEEEECSTGLGLALGMGDYVSKRPERSNKSRVCLSLFSKLCPKEEEEEEKEEEEYATNKRNDFINVNNKSSSRKKLRLTKDQSTLLEDNFKLHTTLNPAQKLALAEQLNLTARQVEVWFQNRRARTKLKQTEVDCEFLKKCCESLSDENSRLKKELQELRSLKQHIGKSQLCLHLPMCPSCDKTAPFGRGPRQHQ